MSGTRSLGRRGFLRLAGTGSALVAAGGLITACGNDTLSGGTTPSGAAAGGSTLRVATLSSPANLDPRAITGGADFITINHVWDSLVLLKGDRAELSLAESVEPNTDGTVWTVRLRDGVQFHDGKPLGAQDVIYSIRLIGDTEKSGFAQFYADVDLTGLQAVDQRTVQIPMRRPRGDFLLSSLAVVSWVYPEGITDFTAGNGSGPFRLVDYRGTEGARLQANPDYWGGAPAIETIEVRGIEEPSARLDAVRGGQIDYASGVSFAGAASVQGDSSVVIRRGGTANSKAYMFLMNVTLPPFDNPQVREAFRLVVDRRALLDRVLLGNGVVGNDVVGKGMPGYNDDLPQREPDLDRARTLLAGAGVSEVTMRTAEVTPGIVDASKLFAEQLAAVGVRCTVNEVPAETFYSDPNLRSTPFQGWYYTNTPAEALIPSYYGSQSAFNTSGYQTPTFDALLADAQAAIDDTDRETKFKELQRMLHAEGGDIVWGFAELLDATAPGVSDVEVIQATPYFAKARLS